MIGHIASRIQTLKQIEILPEILVDPKTNFFEGATQHFGQDINALSQSTSHILLHLNPFTQNFPKTETKEFNEYISQFSQITQRKDTINNSLMIWGVNKESLDFILDAKVELNSRNIFLMHKPPLSIEDRKSYHLGLF